MMTKAKVVGNYANSQLAKVEAIHSGYDEAIMLDVQGNVAEGSGGNIFIVRRGELRTPPLTAILEGITRNSIRRSHRATWDCRSMKPSFHAMSSISPMRPSSPVQRRN